MTKMAVMPTYGKILWKILFSRTNWRIALEFGM